ncbi:MAG: condensation domain-containing protein [Bacteroidota bacterium]
MSTLIDTPALKVDEPIAYLEQIPKIERDNDFRASYVQAGHWVMHHYTKNKKTFNSFIVERLPFFDREVGMRALQTIIERHDILRTTYEFKEGELQQRIHPFEHFKDSIEMIRMEETGEDASIELARIAYYTNFDPDGGPLFYITVAETLDDFVFVMNIDHSITDDLSNAILKREIMEVYQAYLQGKPNPLPPSRVQYKDFVYWHDKLLKKEVPDRFLRYWNRDVDTRLPKTDLSTHFSKDPIPRESYEVNMKRMIDQCLKPMPPEHENLVYGNLAKLELREADGFMFFIQPKLYKQLRQLARDNDTTLFNILTTGLHMLIYRLTGSPDSILGMNMVMRHNEDLVNMVGFMLNTVLLRNTVKAEETIHQNIQRIASDNLDASELAFYPLGRVLQDFDFPFRTISKIFINMINKDDSERILIRKFKPKHMNRQIWMSYFDLDLHIVEQKNGVSFVCEYVKSVFQPEDMESFYEGYIDVLTRMAAAADQTVASAMD